MIFYKVLIIIFLNKNTKGFPNVYTTFHKNFILFVDAIKGWITDTKVNTGKLNGGHHGTAWATSEFPLCEACLDDF